MALLGWTKLTKSTKHIEAQNAQTQAFATELKDFANATQASPATLAKEVPFPPL
jgi:hypothetical protein